MSVRDGAGRPGAHGSRPAGVAAALRDGWHGLAGGDAGSCPGCPVCAVADQVGGADPATAVHLQAAAGHLAAAGRELLAALAGRGSHHRVEDPADPGGPADPGEAGDPHGPAHPGDPDDEPAPAWTRIPVATRPTDEEHP